ncbi:MAG: N-acetyltransferase [Herbaspirillum sp.]
MLRPEQVNPAVAVLDPVSSYLPNGNRERWDISFESAESEDESDFVLSVKNFRIRFADTEEGRNSASMLVNKMYSWRGYAGVHKIAKRKNRITLTASMDVSVIGTVTLSLDSPTGLMADEVFKDQIDLRRGPGRKLCELTKLAFDPSVKSPFALAALFHMCFIYARRMNQCTDAFIEVNPRHRRYYEKMLGFKLQGERRTNNRVNAPAYLLWIDLDNMEELVEKFGGTSDHTEVVRSLYPYFFSAREELGITNRLIALE